MKVIIIDDESLAREIIKKYLSDFPKISVIAECSNGFEGVKAVNDLKPDLLFLDIQMPKLSGSSCWSYWKNPRNHLHTAFDQFAIKAFEVNAIDYLLKPFPVNVLLKLSQGDHGIKQKPVQTLDELVEYADKAQSI
jgi:two-component system LytT family response regulator